MLKLLFTGLWVCAVTLGAVYFSVKASTPPSAADEEAAAKAALVLVRGESITVPVIGEGGVNGYFISRVSFRMDKEKMAKLEVPVNELMTDQMFTLLTGEKMIDLANVKSFDVDGFKTRIRDDLNGKLGEGLVSEVLLEQLDYLSKSDIRSMNAGPGAPSSVKVVPGDKVEDQASAAPAAASH